MAEKETNEKKGVSYYLAEFPAKEKDGALLRCISIN
jgi:hypothetical protein